MKLPLSWLKDYVEFDDTVEGLARKLTFSGTEVEGIATVGGDYAGVVVGEVKAVDPHPNADRLTLCRVSDGKKEYSVVCGAPNVEVGAKYPFAPIGTKLPGGMKIKAATIRGVASEGMLCAEDELALSDEHTGLMTLDPGATPGTALSEILGPPETVLDLEITPNRPDCLSIIGIAREIAALYGTKLNRPDVKLLEKGEPAEKLTRVDIEDTEICPRYTARILTDVKIGPSPDWMQRRLMLCGVRPINNVVDITNYVLLECGHPLHAFDQTLLDEGRIVVRRAKEGEVIITLDDIERKLTPEMLVIADAGRAVALAGVMGGAGSEIRDGTQTILLESAYFKPDNIRATSRQLGLSTESSYRFERGTDIVNAEWASRRASALMVEFAGATAAQGVVDAFPSPPSDRLVSCRAGRTSALLGLEVSLEDMQRIFESLELTVVDTADGVCTVCVPPFRGDIERDVDLIEEFARIHGLDKIPSPPPRTELVPDADDHRMQAERACRANLVGLGLNEIMNYSLVSEQLLDLFKIEDPAQRIVLPHPISMDQSILRTTLIPQMVLSLGHNRSRGIEQAAFFEVGRVYLQKPDGSTEEEERVALGLMGPVSRSATDKRRPVEALEIFLWMKGILGALLEAQGCTEWSAESLALPCMAENQCVSILIGGKRCGCMGIVRQDIRGEWRLNEPVAVAELDFGVLLEHVFDVNAVVTPPVYPSVARDIAIIVDKIIEHQDVVDVILGAAPKELENIELFDIFEGEAIGKGKRSLAYSLTYRSPTGTLTDEQANGYHEAVKQGLRKALDVEIREG